ncbi:MAG: hypothetical protein JNG84_02820 [Archangium sp.]|nr:hypothetical protein [Archangium sp.]
MGSSDHFPDDVAALVQRCAEAQSDLPRLRVELQVLRTRPEPHAAFATALFDLDRARRGDAEARGNMLDVADHLLVFWRNGEGTTLATAHPALQTLWDAASSLLASFEAKRFGKALQKCWDVRGDAVLLGVAINDLLPEGNRRVEFARCLYHLELARMFVDASRTEFAKRAGLLSEAYQSPEVASNLIGDDAGLRFLWDELEPYLDEFFEMMEEAAERRRRRAAGLDTSPGAPAAPSRNEVKTDPALGPPAEAVDEFDIEEGAPEPLGASRPIPSFRTLMGMPPPPPDTTPPGSWVPPKTKTDEIEIVDMGEAPRASAPPPPPPPLEADVDIDVDVAETTPLAAGSVMAALKSPGSSVYDIVIDEPDPEANTIAFWQHTLKALDLLPDPKVPRAARRYLNADSRGDRKVLTEYLDGLDAWLHVDDATSFAALVRLMLAGQLKEKSLFGQPNARRAEAFAQAFAMLRPTPRAAGHGAVWFVMDGKETEAALHRGLDVMMRFLAFCARTQQNPLDAGAQQRFLSEASP